MPESSQAIIFYPYTSLSVERIIKFSLVRSCRRKKEEREQQKKLCKMLKMLSKDMNAAMNYSVMTTRSVREGKKRALLTSARCSEGAVQSRALTPERL